MGKQALPGGGRCLGAIQRTSTVMTPTAAPSGCRWCLERLKCRLSSPAPWRTMSRLKGQAPGRAAPARTPKRRTGVKGAGGQGLRERAAVKSGHVCGPGECAAGVAIGQGGCTSPSCQGHSGGSVGSAFQVPDGARRSALWEAAHLAVSTQEAPLRTRSPHSSGCPSRQGQSSSPRPWTWPGSTGRTCPRVGAEGATPLQPGRCREGRDKMIF